MRKRVEIKLMLNLGVRCRSPYRAPFVKDVVVILVYDVLDSNQLVASCWSSSGDVELSMLLLPHTRTHLRTQNKKKFCTYHSNGWRNEAVRYIWYQSRYDPRLGIHYGFRWHDVIDYSVADWADFPVCRSSWLEDAAEADDGVLGEEARRLQQHPHLRSLTPREVSRSLDRSRSQ